MAEDAFERVLRLVSEGKLTAEEAGPILDALDVTRAGSPSRAPGTRPPGGDDSPARALRVEIGERGRTVVNLRIPISLGRAAINHVPGISEMTSERIREAIAAGIMGPIIDVDEDGDSVRISIE
ncbi:MAG: SHOCT-like domain-containing protein [Candidatus Limnocylindrales bacterium]